MPETKYAPLTEQEVKQVLTKHKELVDDMNKYLPAGQKLSVDKNLATKLKDPKVAALYRIGSEIREKSDKQREILLDSQKKYGYPKKIIDGYYIDTAFKTGGTLDDNKYNERLYKDFQENNDKYLAKSLNNLFNIKARDLYKLGDDPIAQAEFYRDHYEECTNAYYVKRIVEANDNKDLINDDLRKNISSINGFAQMINSQKYSVANYNSIENLAFPKLNEAQAEALYDVNYGYKINQNRDLERRVIDAKYPDKVINAKDYFDNIKENTGVDLSNEGKFITKFVAKNDGVICDMDLAATIGSGENVTIEAKDPAARFEVEAVTPAFKEQYLKNYQNRLDQKLNIKGPFNVKNIEAKTKPGFFERLGGTSSKEYKAMIQAVKDYNDPNSKYYLNHTHLKGTANDYLNHKHAQGYDSSKTPEGTTKERMGLANAILDMDKEHEKVMEETRRDLAPTELEVSPTKKVSFLEEKDLEENELTNEKEVSRDVNKDNLIEEDISLHGN